MSLQDYYRSEGLADLVGETADVSAIPPDADDLARLHSLLRERRVASVLEFGVGYSTLIIADALRRNAAEFGSLDTPGAVSAHAHRGVSVDTNSQWIDVARRRVPQNLQQFVSFHLSSARAATFNGQLCHYYDCLPDIVPEFVYLDGPDPGDVAGTVNGIGFSNPERTPLAADLLLLEPTILPRTMILVDGRTNNARFLMNNLRRTWRFEQDPDGRFSILELCEEPLGLRNKKRINFCLGNVV